MGATFTAHQTNFKIATPLYLQTHVKQSHLVKFDSLVVNHPVLLKVAFELVARTVSVG